MPIDASQVKWDAPDPKAVVWDAPAEKPSFMQSMGREALNSIPAQALFGAARGIGGIGATVGMQGEQGRKAVENKLVGMGADPESLSYKGGKLASEIGATWPIGGLLAKGAAAIPGVAQAAPGLINALRTSGMTTGAAPANFLSKAGLSDIAIRSGAAATVGLGSAAAVGDDPMMGAAIGGATPGAFKAAGMAGSKVGNFLRPDVASDVMTAAGKARELGYVVPPTQANPSMINRLIEGYAGKLTTAQNASAKNAGVTNELANKALGLPGGTTLSPEVLGDVRKAAGHAYADVANMPGRESVDETLHRLQSLINKAESEKTSALQIAGKLQTMRAQQANLAHGRDISLSKNQPEFQPYYNPGTNGRTATSPSSLPVPGQPRIPGRYTHNIERSQEALTGAEDAMAVFTAKRAEESAAIKALEDFQGKASGFTTKDAIDPRQMVFDLRQARNDADSWYKSYQRTADPTSLEKAKAAKAMATSLENALEGHAQNINRADLVDAMRESRNLIAKTYSVENALNKTTGTIDARKLAQQIQSGKPLTGELRDIGEFAARFPKAANTIESMGSLPQNSPLDFAAGGIGSAMSGNLLPLAGAIAGRPLARKLALSDLIQGGLGKPQTQSKLRELLSSPEAQQLMYRLTPISQ